mmetsp:Transcript_54451/g.100663  ORF Transcript_54451/g.100663 Transcript_54451/m.100663 type:complete len:627 (-) Transcript_54451:73-1953(-)
MRGNAAEPRHAALRQRRSLEAGESSLDLLGVPRGLCQHPLCRGCPGFARTKPSEFEMLDWSLLRCARCDCLSENHLVERVSASPRHTKASLLCQAYPALGTKGLAGRRQGQNFPPLHADIGDYQAWETEGTFGPIRVGDLVSFPNCDGELGTGIVRNLVRMNIEPDLACLISPMQTSLQPVSAGDVCVHPDDVMEVELGCEAEKDVQVVHDFEDETQFPDLIFQAGGMTGLAACLRRKQCKLCVLGGSISLQKAGYRGHLIKALERRGVAVEDINAMFGVAGSKPLSLVVDDFVVANKPDLLIIEVAVNDGDELLEGTPRPDVTGIVRAAEGIVRTVKKNSPHTTIVFLEMFLRDDTEQARVLKTGSEAWRDSKSHAAIGWYHHVAPRLHRHVCRNYGLTQIDLIPAFKSLASTSRHLWFRDDCHHTEMAGERLGNLLARLLLWAVRQQALPLPPTLSPALDWQCWCNGRTMYVNESWLTPPFSKFQERDPMRLGAQATWMLLEAGGKATIPFKGRACGLVTFLGPDAPVVQVSIDGGVGQEMSLLDHWSYYWRDAVILLCEGLADTTHLLEIEVLHRQPDPSILKRRPTGIHWDQCLLQASQQNRPYQRLWLLLACAVEGDTFSK